MDAATCMGVGQGPRGAVEPLTTLKERKKERKDVGLKVYRCIGLLEGECLPGRPNAPKRKASFENGVTSKACFKLFGGPPFQD